MRAVGSIVVVEAFPRSASRSSPILGNPGKMGFGYLCEIEEAATPTMTMTMILTLTLTMILTLILTVTMILTMILILILTMTLTLSA